MPLDNASFITGMNPNNPNGAVDKVSSLDNHIREVKRAVTQSLPNIGGAVKYSHAELNDMRDNFSRKQGDTEWDCHDNALINVTPKDDDNAVQPRITNDKRYLQIENNLAELSTMDKAELIKNLFSDEIMVELEKKLFEKQYPIGHVITNTNDARNPETYLGFGKWKAYGAGRVVIGAGNTVDINNISRTFAAASEGGEFMHTLTEAEMPRHYHDSGAFPDANVAAKNPHGSTNRKSDTKATEGGHNEQSEAKTSAVGGNQAHNIIQPYIVAYMWERYQ